MGITILKKGYFEDFDFCSVMYFCIVLLPKVEVKVEVTTQKGSVNFRKGRPENWKTLVFSEGYRLRLSLIGRGGEIPYHTSVWTPDMKKRGVKSITWNSDFTGVRTSGW